MYDLLNGSVSSGGESTLDLCYASSEEIPELQRPRRATGNRRNLQCGDDFILPANVTRDKGSPCLGAVGPRSGGSALLVVGSSVLVCILLCSLSSEHEWSGPQHPAHGTTLKSGVGVVENVAVR